MYDISIAITHTNNTFTSLHTLHCTVQKILWLALCLTILLFLPFPK